MLNIRFREKTNTWPGFVDLFSNLVIILIFLLIVFVFLWTTTSVFNKKSGMKTVADLKRANSDQSQTIAQMSADEQEAKRLLIMARNELESLTDAKASMESQIGDMDAQMQQQDTALQQQNDAAAQQQKQMDQMATELAEKNAAIDDLNHQLSQATSNAQNEQNVDNVDTAQMQDLIAQNEQQRATIESLNTQLSQAVISNEQNASMVAERRQMQDDMSAQRASLVDQLAQLQSALDAAEAKSAAQQVQYTEMSNRLNKALADKIAELNKIDAYQSDFYRAIKTALGDNTNLQTEGDRFIISSDILFGSGEYGLSAEGRNQLRLIANVIMELEHKIPSDVKWIIRIDGHTDKKPVVPGTRAFANNTQLSLLRATAVAKELAHDGVSRRRLVPSGFGELHPIELGTDPASLQRNRRIELQLTNR